MDNDLQTINEDIAQIFLKYLQNYLRDLLALSLSCKQWQTRANLFVAKRLQYLAPKTQISSVAHRNTLYEELLLVMQNASDIRIFEERFFLPSGRVALHHVPWEKDIVFLHHNSLFVVLNTTDGSIIYRGVGCTFEELGLKQEAPMSFNEHLRMVAVASTNPDVIRIFSLNDKKMGLVRTSKVKYKLNTFLSIALTNNGTVWMYKKPVFSIKSDTPDFSLPDHWHVVKIRQNDVLYYYVDDEETTIRCYDIAARKSWIYFSHERLIPDDGTPVPEITFHPNCELIKVGNYDSALLQVVDGKLKFIMTAKSLFNIQLSPDRTKFFYAKFSSLTVYSIASGTEEYIQTLPLSQLYDYYSLCKDEKLCTRLKKFKLLDTEGLKTKFSERGTSYDFYWMDNETIFGISRESRFNGAKILKIDIKNSETNVRGTNLPKKFQDVSNHSIIDERTAILHAATDTSSAVIKITL